jgi:hypothetical protein
MPARILYAITGHGFGHATRSLAIGSRILSRSRDLTITYSTRVARSFLERSGAGQLSAPQVVAGPSPGPGAGSAPAVRASDYREKDYEPGTVERTCFEVDREATRTAYRRFQAERERRIAEEAAFLEEGGYAGVVSDVAAVPIAAAARAGIPSVAVSNFTWDWILDPLLEGAPDLERLPGLLAGDYRSAATYLRLPFHPAVHPFRSVEELPLVGRRGSLPREEVRSRLGLGPPARRPVVLVTIGGFQAGNWPAVRVTGCSGLEFLLVGDLPIEAAGAEVKRIPADESAVPFPDLVAAADLVLAKPGYGICSECAVNGRPMVAVERRGFREYGSLKEGLARLVPFREISQEEFFAGEWGPAIASALAAGAASPAAVDGAAVAARRILEVLGLE